MHQLQLCSEVGVSVQSFTDDGYAPCICNYSDESIWFFLKYTLNRTWCLDPGDLCPPVKQYTLLFHLILLFFLCSFRGGDKTYRFFVRAMVCMNENALEYTL